MIDKCEFKNKTDARYIRRTIMVKLARNIMSITSATWLALLLVVDVICSQKEVAVSNESFS